jgi:hypothetical protein
MMTYHELTTALMFTPARRLGLRRLSGRTMTQLLGFTASALVISASTMRSVAWLRAFGLIGSMTFITYGIALTAWPIVATNVVTTAVHLHRLRAIADDDASDLGPPIP